MLAPATPRQLRDTGGSRRAAVTTVRSRSRLSAQQRILGNRAAAVSIMLSSAFQRISP
jgi:hypothetical protein